MKHDWTQFRREEFNKTRSSLAPILKQAEEVLMESIEFCEVAELHQRFRDFLHEAEAIELKVNS